MQARQPLVARGDVKNYHAVEHEGALEKNWKFESWDEYITTVKPLTYARNKILYECLGAHVRFIPEETDICIFCHFHLRLVPPNVNPLVNSNTSSIYLFLEVDISSYCLAT